MLTETAREEQQADNPSARQKTANEGAAREVSVRTAPKDKADTAAEKTVSGTARKEEKEKVESVARKKEKKKSADTVAALQKVSQGDTDKETEETATTAAATPAASEAAQVTRDEAEGSSSTRAARSTEEDGEQDNEIKGDATELTKEVGVQETEGMQEFMKTLEPVTEGNEKQKFEEAVKRDESLKTWRELGDKNMQGFRWNNVQGKMIEWEIFGEVVVVPKEYRQQILELSHDKLGHLGGEKVWTMIRRRFTWPNMKSDVYEHCQSCDTCQRHSKYVPRRAPMVARPVITEPFESIAIDLVGPLPKGKGGCEYVLTSVCLATRWPSAVALKSITAKAVAEALWSIFANTTIPDQILSDQGPQFMSSLMKELTTFIGVNHVKSSPYHPQTNGALERLHGTFKSVLKKSIERKINWMQQFPFALFVLRQMPSTDHGLSPFELIYGSRSRTPLEALYYGLMEHEGEHLKVSPWVNNLTDRLQIVREEAAVATAKAIERRKTAYDRSSKLRAFNIGEKVRYRIPGMHGSLSESWDGPYVVQKKYRMVNYRIQREGVRTPGKVTKAR